MNPGMRAAISKKSHCERGWESLVKIAKNYHNVVGSLYISIINLILITTSCKELLKTRNAFKNLQKVEISLQSRRSRG